MAAAGAGAGAGAGGHPPPPAAGAGGPRPGPRPKNVRYLNVLPIPKNTQYKEIEDILKEYNTNPGKLDANRAALAENIAKSVIAIPKIYEVLFDILNNLEAKMSDSETYVKLNERLRSKPQTPLSTLIARIVAPAGAAAGAGGAPAGGVPANGNLFKFYIKGGNAVPLLLGTKEFVNDFDTVFIINYEYKNDEHFEEVRVYIIEQLLEELIKRFSNKQLWEKFLDNLPEKNKNNMSKEERPFIKWPITGSQVPTYVTDLYSRLRDKYIGDVFLNNDVSGNCPFNYELIYNHGYMTKENRVDLNISLLRLKTREAPTHKKPEGQEQRASTIINAIDLIDISIPNSKFDNYAQYWNTMVTRNDEFNINVASPTATRANLEKTISGTIKNSANAGDKGRKFRRRTIRLKQLYNKFGGPPAKLGEGQLRIKSAAPPGAAAALQPVVINTAAPRGVSASGLQLLPVRGAALAAALAAAPSAALQPVVINTAYAAPAPAAAAPAAAAPAAAAPAAAAPAAALPFIHPAQQQHSGHQQYLQSLEQLVNSYPQLQFPSYLGKQLFVVGLSNAIYQNYINNIPGAVAGTPEHIPYVLGLIPHFYQYYMPAVYQQLALGQQIGLQAGGKKRTYKRRNRSKTRKSKRKN